MKYTSLLTLPLALMMLAACHDDDPVPAYGDQEQIGRFAYTLRNTQDSMTVTLDGIGKEISGVDNPMSWLSVKVEGKGAGGNCRVKVLRVKPTPERFTADSMYVRFPDKEYAVIVVVAEGELIPLSDNASGVYDNFNREWWNQGGVLFRETRIKNSMTDTFAEIIGLPWGDYATSNIPAELLTHDAMTAEQGWTMAYNLFAAEVKDRIKHISMPASKPYFALYNKYTGILRMFYYQGKTQGTGGEFSFMVTPSDAFSPKFPYYHSLQYAIPVCNTEVPKKGNVLDPASKSSVFKQIVTPYLREEVMLREGWYCFDVDLSCYRPGQTAPFLSGDKMAIDCLTSDSAKITLAGTISGESSGTLEGLSNSSASTSNGMNYLDQFHSGTDNAMAALNSLLEGNYLMAAFKGGMTLWNYGKALTGNAKDEYTAETKSTGTINQSMTGKVNMAGYITHGTSNDAVGVEFKYNAFSLDNAVGRGVWSLQDNPVVYVVKDRLLGEDEMFACRVEENGYSYAESDPSVNNLRVMTYLDPKSIHINLNTSLYRNIRNVVMNWTYGVYPNQPAGHTDVYRIGMLDFKANKMLDEPEFINKKVHKGKLYKSLSSDFANMEYMEAPLAGMQTTGLVSGKKAKIYAQKGSNYRYYAQPGNDRKEGDADFFLVDPVVMLPVTYVEADKDKMASGRIYDFEAPDFVVGVTLTFDYDLESGRKATAVLSKRFLPQVKAVSTADMLKKRAELDTYVKGGVHEEVEGVTIRHKGAAELLKQFFSTGKFIQDNK